MASVKETGTVVLLHGIWTKGLELVLLKRRLQRAGFNAFVYSYPAISMPLEENVRGLWRFMQKRSDSPVALVGHSYGGIVACSLLRQMESGLFPRIGIKKCVFLAVPLLGSVLAQRLGHLSLSRIATGHSLRPLQRGCSLVPGGMVESIMIAGTMNLGFGTFLINGPGDGVVALPETMAPWLDHHHTVQATHLGVVFSKKAAGLCVDFLSSQAV